MCEQPQVRDIYRKGVAFCKPQAPLHEVVRVMTDADIDAIVVAEDEDSPPMGMVSDARTVAHYGKDLVTFRARDAMVREVITVYEDDSLEEAARRLQESRTNRLLVVDAEGNPRGILSVADVLRKMRGARWVWYRD